MKVNELPYRILALSDSPTTCTGFASCTKDLMNGLSRKPYYDVSFLGHNYLGQDLMPGVTFEDGTKLNFRLHGHGRQPYGADIMESLIKKYKTNVFYICLDTFMLWPWLMHKNLTPAKTIFHFPSDGEGNLPAQNEANDCVKLLQHVDLPVAMSRFAQRQVKEVYNMDVPYIPLGVNTNIFYPLSSEMREKIREQTVLYQAQSDGSMVPMKGVMKNKFVIGSVFRNQPRKFADRIIKTAAIMLKEHKVEDFVIVLHCDPTDVSAPFDIQYLARREGVGHKIFYTGMTFFKGFPVTKMNEVYNMFDVFFLATSGEGFGIPYLEANSCGVPCVGTNYTTIPELILEDGQSGEVIKLLGVEKDIENKYHNGEITGSWTVERALGDCFDAAEKLLKLKNDSELRIKYGQAGRKKAVEIYDWEILIEKWDKLILELIEK